MIVFFDIRINFIAKMTTIEKIRTALIDRILTIDNEEFLEALNKLIVLGSGEAKPVKLTDEQKAMLELSEQDIKNGDLISQEAMDRRNLEWLNAM
jgi:hypothetical protein